MSESSFPTDYTIGPYTDSTWGIDNVPTWGIDDWGIDFGGGGGTTGGDTGFWNQGVGGQILGGLTDFGIAGLNAGMGMSAMNQAQQAAQVQAERAALAQQRSDIWSAGLQRLADDTEYERQRDAKLFNIAHLNAPNVIQAEKRNMLRSAAVAGVKPQDAAYYAFIT
jgi:hypothetical protein